MYTLARSALFRTDPETAHNIVLISLNLFNRGPLGAWMRKRVPPHPVDVMGLHFPNPVGLSAGLDKDGVCIKGLANLGFGFVEIGTVTPKAQSGNPTPRLFRLPSHEAIINRMGFNNAGVDALVDNVKRAGFNGILGINIGKNRDTALELASHDYLHCMRMVYPHADYITVNVSSPNTPGLRDLQRGDALESLFDVLKAEQRKLTDQHSRYVPVAIKIAPDLDEAEIDTIAATVRAHAIDAVIATNTTNDRTAVTGAANAEETGGLSGAPLTNASTAVVAKLAKTLNGHTPIIAVGGIMRPIDAVAKLNAGAHLVQLYSGLIYRGPGLIGNCVKALAKR
ncbi:MAG: quinone-dependent dihydroorotate dehydrogenase [Pseudomonadota bacterium]